MVSSWKRSTAAVPSCAIHARERHRERRRVCFIERINAPASARRGGLNQHALNAFGATWKVEFCGPPVHRDEKPTA
jgi:hypothetical protein